MTDPLTIVRVLPHPAEVVFDAWIVPTMMRKWLFASERGDLIAVEADPVVGGRYSILEHLDGQHIDHFGEYLIVDRPDRLCFSLDVPQHFPESTVIDLRLAPRGPVTELHFTQRGIDADTTRPFWEQMLDKLAAVLAD